MIASVYLVGQVVGALVFGRMSDQLGRKRLLVVTLLLYLLGTGLAAFTVNDGGWLWLVWFYGTRFIAGMGIGGQYAAINSAIDEMMPSKYRGRVDIWINGSYWAGAILGSLASLFFLNAFAPDVGWRLAFLMGPVLALVVIVVARTLPESPRWLMTHGRMEEAEEALAGIEEACRKAGQELEPVDDSKALELTPEKKYGYVTFLGLVFRTYPKRAVLGATLMITQSFLYNAIYFTYGLVLVQFYGVSADMVPLYGLAFAVGNLCGPLILAPLFDSVGRKPMISGTYIISGVLLAISGWLFDRGDLTATTQTFCWIIIFFFASAGASAAYLTVSETWPIEIRAEAIAVFFAIAQIFGAFGPVFYGWLIGDRHRSDRALHRLPHRGSDHGLRRDRRASHRDQGGGQIARGHHEADHVHGGHSGSRGWRPRRRGSSESTTWLAGPRRARSTGRGSSRGSRSSRSRRRARSSPTRPSTTSRARSTRRCSCRR